MYDISSEIPKNLVYKWWENVDYKHDNFKKSGILVLAKTIGDFEFKKKNHRGRRKWSNLSKITQLISSRAESLSQAGGPDPSHH